MRRLLVVEDDPAEQLSVTELLGHDDIEITTAGTGAEALAAHAQRSFDCVVLDLRLPDMSGFELLAEVQADAELRRHADRRVHRARAVRCRRRASWRKSAKSIVLKGVRSPERLLDETALFLHRVIADLPPAKQQMIETLHESDEPLRGRKVLVVDDDIRNIFALNSLLERHNMQVITATNGQEAIDLVESTEDLSLVLMDVMMPEMDGYETMRRIRSKPRVPAAADHRADGQGHEGRPGEVPGGGRLRLRRQAGEHRPAAVTGAHVAAPLNADGSLHRSPRCEIEDKVNILLVDDQPARLLTYESILSDSARTWSGALRPRGARAS